MSRPQLAVFATGCVTRVAPLVHALGSPVTDGRLTAAVQALWSSDGSLPAAEARRLVLAYDQAPENSPDVDSANDPRYWVMSVLAMLTDAVSAASLDAVDDDVRTIGTGEEVVPRVAVSGLELLANLDAVREEHRGPSYQGHGPEELAEVAAREESMRILRSEPSLGEQATRVRALSERRRDQLPVPARDQLRYTPRTD